MQRFRKRISVENAEQLFSAHSREVSSPDICAEPKVSVIFLTFNHAPFVKQALDSAIAQEAPFEFEIIVGDDASPDGTLDILRDYQKRYPDKIRLLIAEENLGQHTESGNPNLLRCLRQVRGKYVAFLEGDDYWTDPAKLEKQFALCEAKPHLAGCFHHTDLVGEEGTVEKGDWFQDLSGKREVGLQEVISVFTPFHTSSFFAKAECFRNLPGFFINAVSGDLFLFSMAAAKGPLGQIEDTMSIYRKHAGGITNTAVHRERVPNLLARMEVFSQLHGYFDATLPAFPSEPFGRFYEEVLTDLQGYEKLILSEVKSPLDQRIWELEDIERKLKEKNNELREKVETLKGTVEKRDQKILNLENDSWRNAVRKLGSPKKWFRNG